MHNLIKAYLRCKNHWQINQNKKFIIFNSFKVAIIYFLDIDQSNGWFGRQCCHLAQSQSCLKSCQEVCDNKISLLMVLIYDKL